MSVTTYWMNKTLKQAAAGEAVDFEDFIRATEEKKKRAERKKNAYRKRLLKTIKDVKDEENRNQQFKDTLEKKVKFCPRCGYKTVIDNHKFICIRKCRQCNWESKPWQRRDDVFSI